MKVGLPQDPRLVAGLFGRVAVPAGRVRRLRIPAQAVSRVGQLEYVTAVRADGTLERRLVTTGPADGQGGVELLSGLAGGERVLLPPAS